ncbi:MAG TPA: hypothetical protein PLJ33_08270 [Peptococcaceae bacterium]|mgnify:CR=1 FL=1|jgi:hypothetical protein|nr:hypothetical protein [Clostridia bacterium]HOB82778.1 hypothetical protein [Peptococcaceae bacterium]HPZ72170.1 hypothetical protein [Peptococcaceae bacterium]HQD54824.1 hypothetical protein [Peptococcaceae bacterium]
MKVFLLIVAFLAMILFEVPGLIRKKYWRELVAFAVLLLIAFIFSFLNVLGVKLPCLTAVITSVVNSVLNAVEALFK